MDREHGEEGWDMTTSLYYPTAVVLVTVLQYLEWPLNTSIMGETEFSVATFFRLGLLPFCTDIRYK